MVKIKSTKLKDMKAGKDASLELAKYLKDHKLDPKKDWTKHPVHGKKISQWVKIIKLAEKKAEDVQMERVANGTTKKLKKPNVHTKVTTVREQPRAYDYPLVDGKPMDSNSKKKFRQKMRSLLKANMDESKATSIALEFALSNAKKVLDKVEKENVKKEKKLKKKVSEEAMKEAKSEKNPKKKVKDASKKAAEKSAKKKVKKVKTKKEED